LEQINELVALRHIKFFEVKPFRRRGIHHRGEEMEEWKIGQCETDPSPNAAARDRSPPGAIAAIEALF
jgi:hypothetical protein